MPLIHASPPSFMSLYIEMFCNGQRLGSGTAFVVTRPEIKALYLITNWHNLAGRDPETKKALHWSCALPEEIIIHHNCYKYGMWTPVKEKLHDAAGKPLWHAHPTYGEKVDVAALPISKTDDFKLYPYDYTAPWRIAVDPSDRVNVVGFPFDLKNAGFPIWNTGFMASECHFNHDDLPLFLIDCRTRRGQSGSPVIAYRQAGIYRRFKGIHYADDTFDGSRTPHWDLLGIYSGRVKDSSRVNEDPNIGPPKEGSDLCRVWKAQVIQEILDAIP